MGLSCLVKRDPSFYTFLLSIYCEAGAVLAGDADMDSAPTLLTIQLGRQTLLK